MVSTGALPTLRTWIRYLGAGLLSGATATVTCCGGADAGFREGGATAGGAEGGVGSALTRATTATGGCVAQAGTPVGTPGVAALGRAVTPGRGVVAGAGVAPVEGVTAGGRAAAGGRGAAAASGATAGRAGMAARMPRQCTNTARALWCRVDAGIRTNLRSRR
ncbi:hypothetical protein GCM10011576_58110 [Micromonospora parathelypteridis]|nr:hypothetical protein GCM10011576_58110 [Micromonospora parathelypteridis]